MKSLQALTYCKKISAISLNRGICTDSVLLARSRGRVSRTVSYEPGLRHRLRGSEDELEDIEQDEIDGQLDVMNIENVYDSNKSETKKERAKIRHLITVKKFFSPSPQPLMLTVNERECIRYLNKQDPVQWDLKTLSESFPATPETIKKILKAKWKITPERAKILDSKAQKNWELLAEGKLEAEPHLLNHFKKFINKREVLLEQIKNEKFYLPEIKKERVWNKGEFGNILSKYEKAVQKMIENTEKENKPKMIEGEITSKKTLEKNGKNYLNVLHEKIIETASRPELANKDSFMFGGVTSFYSKPKTFEDLESEILKKADANKKLDLMDKAILDETLNMQGHKTPINTESISESESHDAMTGNPTEALVQQHSKKSYTSGFSKKWDLQQARRMEEEMETFKKIVEPDERTKFTSELNIGKILGKIQEESQRERKNAAKPEIDFSDPIRVERENEHYDKEVRNLEKTAFWNTGRTSKGKAEMELQKKPHSGPDNFSKGANFAATATLSQDSYPERIFIPKSKRKAGATYKIKDCYYDDDGQFLYRVPGMTS